MSAQGSTAGIKWRCNTASANNKVKRSNAQIQCCQFTQRLSNSMQKKGQIPTASPPERTTEKFDKKSSYRTQRSSDTKTPKGSKCPVNGQQSR